MIIAGTTTGGRMRKDMDARDERMRKDMAVNNGVTFLFMTLGLVYTYTSRVKDSQV